MKMPSFVFPPSQRSGSTKTQSIISSGVQLDNDDLVNNIFVVGQIYFYQVVIVQLNVLLEMMDFEKRLPFRWDVV
jgi:hypothetical protein